MDVGTDNFNRDVKGIPEQDYLDISATKQFPLGTRYRRYCGRRFYYAKAAAVALVCRTDPTHRPNLPPPSLMCGGGIDAMGGQRIRSYHHGPARPGHAQGHSYGVLHAVPE